MNFSSIRQSHSVTHSRESRGFTLVVTLSLMILLTVVAVGMLSLATISLRSTGKGETLARARANARLALVMAIGDLQKHAGPDTRVTANANLTDSGSADPYWLGVWKTRNDEDLAAGNPGTHPTGYQRNAYYMSDLRASGSPEPAEQWLVSSPDPDGATPGGSPGTDHITLLDTSDAKTSVNVPQIPLYDAGSCAWWISDESQKALVNLPDLHRGNNSPQSYSLAIAQDFDFETYDVNPPLGKPLAGIASSSPEKLNTVISLNTASLLDSIQNKDAYLKAMPESYHHLSTDSAGLFTDVKNSGLKRDLSAFLALGDIAADSSSGLAGLSEDTPILKGRFHLKTSPRFGILKAWADLADELDSDSGEAAITPRPPNTYFQNLDKSAPGQVRDLTNVSKPAIQPVVVESSLGWDFSPYSPASGSGDFLRAHLLPRLTLWNPYNVTLKPTRYATLMRHPLYASFTARGTQINSRSGRLYFADLCGTPQSAFVGFVTEATELRPGETKVFTPAINASSGVKLHGMAAAFDPENYASNVLTADQIPGIENFYFDTTIAVPAETTANRFLPYGFSSNANSFYATPGYDDEFLVAQVDSGSSRMTWSDVTANTDSFPRVDHFLCQKWGLNRYHKWYGAEKSDHPSNNGTPFREFKPGAQSIGSIENRRPPRLWRRGVRMAWLNDEAEYTACAGKVPKGRFTHPWFAASNIRGGLYHHPNWANIPFAAGWDFTSFDSHLFFRQPTDPQTISGFFPPSPFGAPDDALPSTCTIYDIPRRNTGIVSLGQLQHAQMSYSTWHPSFVIGHSQSTMNADLDATAIKRTVSNRKRWQGDKPWDYDGIIQNGRGGSTHSNEVLIYDLCYEANEALWDAYMLSSIPYAGGNTAWTPGEPLPVGRYVFNDASSRRSRSGVSQSLTGDPSFPFFRSAEFLVNRGAFNVNSTSVEAWKSLLGSMRGLQREALDGSSSRGEHPLSRSILSQAPGVPSIAGIQDSSAWNAFRTLSDSDLQTLSENIVNEVEKRGPFLSVADFINRRLDTDPEIATCGALDMAIRNSGVFNRGIESAASTNLQDIGQVDTAANRPASMGQGLPGFLSQGDLLTAIAPVITTRGDTFRIRAYGEARSSDGSVTRAWCEAIVQRNIDYIDPTDDPALPAIDVSGSKATVGALSRANLNFGRRFEIRSFRWLDAEEI